MITYDTNHTPASHRSTVEVYPGKDGQWYWRDRADNGKVVQNGEAHPNQWNAVRAASRALGTRLQNGVTAALRDLVVPRKFVVLDAEGHEQKTGWLY